MEMQIYAELKRINERLENIEDILEMLLYKVSEDSSHCYLIFPKVKEGSVFLQKDLNDPNSLLYEKKWEDIEKAKGRAELLLKKALVNYTKLDTDSAVIFKISASPRFVSKFILQKI